MSAIKPGLTEAMRSGLQTIVSGRVCMNQIVVNALQSRELVDSEENITPRGQAALAAPRVTALELESLCAVEQSGIRWGAGDQRLDSEDWITRDYVGAPWRLTGTGTTALNNVRAASGSPDYKEN